MWSHEVNDPSFGREAKAPDVELQHMRRRLAMTRPRVSRSSSHRDERWHARKRVLVDENDAESVDAQISVTASVDASGYENVPQLDP